MRVKSLADLGHVNTGTPQAKQLRAAFAAYESDARKPKSTAGTKKAPVGRTGDSDTTRDPQQILAGMVRVDSELGLWGWEEDFVGAVPGRKFELDLALPEVRLGVEVDGWQYHGQHKASFLRDRDKDYLLSLQGWLVVRVQAGLIVSDPHEAISRVRSFLRVWVPRQRLLLSSTEPGMLAKPHEGRSG